MRVVGYSNKHSSLVSSFWTTTTMTIVLLLDMTTAQSFNSTGPPFDSCNKTVYYTSLLASQSVVTSWSKQDLAMLVESTHRNVLPMNAVENNDNDANSTAADIYTALIDLYPGETPGETVNLIYRQTSVPASPYGTDLTWNVEDLWPPLYGADGYGTLTDVHFKAPADSSVLQQKSGLLFGACGAAFPYNDNSTCTQPASVLTTSDTEQDGKVFLPPASVRGDVARALFYGQLRYAKDLGLTLSDCAPFQNSKFGYLSQLLTWHVQDPVSQEEMGRNDGICNRYQGNRNPFIDFPQLVEVYFGVPDVIVNGAYSNCVSVGATTDDNTTTTNTDINNTSSSSTIMPTPSNSYDAFCSSNPACEVLDLEGDCCPDLNGTMLDCCFMDGTTNGTMAPTSFGTFVLTPVSYPTSAPSIMVGMPTLTPSISALPTIVPPPTASGIITSALCSDNRQCAAFDLEGECCPDLNGNILDCCNAGGGLDQAASDMPSDAPSDMPSSDLLITTTTAPSFSPIANSTTMEPTTTATETSEPTKSPVATPSPGTPVGQQVPGMSMILSGVGNLDDAAITSWTAMTIDFYESVHSNDNRRGRNRQTRRRNRQLETEGIEDFSTAITFQSQNVADNRNTIMYSQQVDYVQTSDDAPSGMQLIKEPFQDESLKQIYTDTLRSSNQAFEALPASGNDAVQLVTPDSTPPTTDPLPTSGAAGAAALSRIVVMMGITTVACLFISTSISLFS